jgi:hypothetical protein
VYIATPSSPSNDRGTHFRHRTCQGFKKLAQIKLFINNTCTWGSVPVDNSKNCIIKAVTNKKITKMMKRDADAVVAVDTAI